MLRSSQFRGIAPILAAFAVGLCAGVTIGALKWRGSAESFHREGRMAAILAQAQQMPKGGLVVIGDSVTERVRFPEQVCGLPALNAGIGWSTSKDWFPDVWRVIDAAKPSIIVVETGPNDLGRYTSERATLEGIATFIVDPPRSTVDGVHPDPRGARQFIDQIEHDCAQRRP